MDCRESYEDLNYNHVAQDKVKWPTFVNMSLNFTIPENRPTHCEVHIFQSVLFHSLSYSVL
jgi:hypothetical protein